MTDETQGGDIVLAEDTTLAPQVEGDTPGDDAAAEPAPAPKAKPTAQERIDELTGKRREAEREAEYWKSRALQAPQPAPQQLAPVQQRDAGRPDPAKYGDGIYDPAYVEDLAGWKADQVIGQRLDQREAQTRIESSVQAFERRSAELYPDGESEGLKKFRQIPTLPQGVQDVLLSSDQGPRIADHLGRNPGELARLSGLSPALQGVELAKLEAKLSAPQPKTATTAPEPPPQARGQGGQFKVSADTDDFASFDKTYGNG